MIDVLNDSALLSLTEVARSLPRINGNRLHSSTVWRWCRVGVKSRSGLRVRLDHVRIGARVFTTADAVNRFVAAVADADAEHFRHEQRVQEKPPTNRQRERSIAHAEKVLEAGGLL